jgi:predicted amidohydrolase
LQKGEAGGQRASMTVTSFKITLGQLNPTVGDIAGNAAKARAARAQAGADGAALVALPELFIAGYPPEDLVLKPAFQAACREAVEDLARETADGGPAMLIGTPWVDDGKLYNAYALLDEGRVAAIRFKVNLPNYGVFDEKRVFAACRSARTPGSRNPPSTKMWSSAWRKPAPNYSSFPTARPMRRAKATSGCRSRSRA